MTTRTSKVSSSKVASALFDSSPYHDIAALEGVVKSRGLELVLVPDLVAFELRQGHAVAGRLMLPQTQSNK